MRKEATCQAKPFTELLLAFSLADKVPEEAMFSVAGTVTRSEVQVDSQDQDE